MKCGIKAWTQEFPGLWSFLAFCQQPTVAEAYTQVLQTRATPRYQQHKDPDWIWNMPNRPNCAGNQGGWKCRGREKPHFKQKLPLRRCVDAKNTKLHIYFFSHSSLRPNYTTQQGHQVCWKYQETASSSTEQTTNQSVKRLRDKIGFRKSKSWLRTRILIGSKNASKKERRQSEGGGSQVGKVFLKIPALIFSGSSPTILS